MTMTSVTRILDVRPDADLCGDTPVMRIIDALSKMDMSGYLEILYENPDHGEDILLWMRKTKQKLVLAQTDSPPRRIVIEKTK